MGKPVVAKNVALPGSGSTKDSNSGPKAPELKKKIDKTKTRDLILNKKPYAVTHIFNHLEVNIARYAITYMVQNNNPAILGDHTSSLTNPPSTTTIYTNVDEQAVVYDNSLIQFDDGIITSVYVPRTGFYYVELASSSKEKLNALTEQFEYAMRRANFYRGKCLQFRHRNGERQFIKFIEPPKTTFDNVVLPKDIMEEYLDNTVNFLCKEELHTITKKRGIILYGDPGVGKTTLVSATFNRLLKENITCIFVTGDSFRRVSPEDTFDFISKYLAPAILVMEDFDLLAYDRSMGNTGAIGDILSCLNGIENIEKPLVVVGTTNRFDVLDQAATRPCRFDRRFKIGYPNEECVMDLWHKMTGLDASSNGFKSYVGKLTGAHIREIANTVWMISKIRKKPLASCVDEAIKQVMSSFTIIMPGPVGFNAGRETSQPDEVKSPDECGETMAPGDVIIRRKDIEEEERQKRLVDNDY